MGKIKGVCKTKLPDFFPKREIYTKWPPFAVRKIFQMTRYEKSLCFKYQGPPKYTQMEIFGMKAYHLATLVQKIKGRGKVLFPCSVLRLGMEFDL
jgi:hypothetical protein